MKRLAALLLIVVVAEGCTLLDLTNNNTNTNDNSTNPTPTPTATPTPPPTPPPICLPADAACVDHRSCCSLNCANDGAGGRICR